MAYTLTYDNVLCDSHVITEYQRKHLIRLKSGKILKMMEKYVNYPLLLEELKNQISNERDYFDLIDLVNSMCASDREKMIDLFNLVRLNDSEKYYKLLIDIDNTTIENSDIATVYYQDREIIPGLMPIIRYYSENGISCSTFLSARPHVIENISIRNLTEKIPTNIRYSISAGSIKPIFRYFIGKIAEKCNDNTKLLEASYRSMADEKYNNFMQLVKLFPSVDWIFLGDDTQGDPYVAYKLVMTLDMESQKKCSWAAIRLVSNRHIPPQIRENKRIIFHKSYYELIYRLIRLKKIDKDIVDLVIDDYESNYKRNNYNPTQVTYDKRYIDKLLNLKK